MFENSRDALWIYHERQEAKLCGQHALNNLVQAAVFTVAKLAEIAHQLDAIHELAHHPHNREVHGVAGMRWCH